VRKTGGIDWYECQTNLTKYSANNFSQHPNYPMYNYDSQADAAF